LLLRVDAGLQRIGWGNVPGRFGSDRGDSVSGYLNRFRRLAKGSSEVIAATTSSTAPVTKNLFIVLRNIISSL